MDDRLFSVKDRIAVVTGGLGQLGAAFTNELLDRGARTAVFSRNVTESRIAASYSQAARDSGNLRFFSVDITRKEMITAALSEIEAAWGVPEILVNNAGIDTQPSSPPEVSGPFEDFPENVFREVVEVNLTGTFLMTQAVGRLMARQGKPQGAGYLNLAIPALARKWNQQVGSAPLASFGNQHWIDLWDVIPRSGHICLQTGEDRCPFYQAGCLFRSKIRAL